MSLEGAKTEIIRSYLISAAEEMQRTLIRTAFNPVIYEVLDFGISIYDAKLDLIAEAPGLALFLGANDYAIKKGVEFIGVENLNPGDILLMNYPYWNSAHTSDVTLFAPVFAPEGKTPFAYTCIRAHWMDLGAKDPGYVLDSTDMHQEGLIFPCTKIYKKGKLDKEILSLISFNSRMPDLVKGDLEAQVAATHTGEKRLNAILKKFGKEALDTAIDHFLEHGDLTTRRELAKLPQGTWEAEDWVDDDGITDDPVRLHVKVTLDDKGMTCDFSDSAKMTRGPINMPFGLTETVCKFVLRSLTNPHAPSNAGYSRALEVIAPEGTICHAVYPAATYTLWTSHLALDLIYKALAQGMPDLLAASSGGDTPGFMMVGTNPKTGAMYAVSNNDPVGWGATAHADGANAVNHLSGALVRNTPIEVMEMKTGMSMESLALRTDSGGAGRQRGGLGTERHIRFTQDGEFLTVTKKTKTRTWALDGGQDTESITMLLFPGTDREKKVGTYRAAVKVGDAMYCISGGGGGYGNPVKRDPAAVLEDVLEGYVSLEAAESIYKVCIENGQINKAKTAELRAGKKK